MKLKIKWLETLRSISTYGGISRAAKYLHCGQPALSMQIKQLEEVLGIEVVKLQGRHLVLTPIGNSILSQYHIARSELLKIEQLASQHLNLHEGSVKVVYTQPVREILFQKIRRFTQLYPNIKFELITANRSALLKTVEQFDCDFAILADIPDKLQKKVWPLYEFNYALVANQNHHLATQMNLSINDLCNETLLVAERHSNLDRVSKALFKESFNKMKVHYFSDVDTLKSAIYSDFGIGLLPDIAIHATDDYLVKLDIFKDKLGGCYYAFSNSAKALTLPATTLLEFISSNESLSSC